LFFLATEEFWIDIVTVLLGWGSSFGIAIRYGQYDPRIEFRGGGGRVSAPAHTGPGANKEAGAWRSPPTPSNAEVKERVELYLHSPSGPSRSVLG
jgi:hypothetical protein